jgi:predicted nucleotidyltransferase component of viral defense system
MTIDIAVHKTLMFQILKEMYSDTGVSPFIGFKGGTAALMFYGLPRFSTDLDFDLLKSNKEEMVTAKVELILKKFGTIKETHNRAFNLFWLLSYGDAAHNIKVEINRRQFGSSFELKTYLGVPMLVMSREDMFAHKLMAMYERIGKTSRDIFDVWFFLSQRFPINKEIVENRSMMKFDELVIACIIKLEKLNNRHILDGVGELIAENQKDWARAKLKEETISLLQLRITE